MTRLLRPARLLICGLSFSLGLSGPAAAADAEAVLLLDPAAVSVELRGAGGLSLPGCRAVDWQRFDADPNPVRDPISVFDADTDPNPNLSKQS